MWKVQIIIRNLHHVTVVSQALFAYVSSGPPPVTSFTKEVNPRLAKRPLEINGRLANRGLTSLVKEATGGQRRVQLT